MRDIGDASIRSFREIESFTPRSPRNQLSSVHGEGRGYRKV